MATFVLLAIMSCFGFAQSNAPVNSIKDIDVVLVQGNASIGTHAPKNWFLDKSAAERMGLCGMYVVNGHNFDNSPAIIYPRISDEKCEDDRGLERIIQDVATQYKSMSDKFKLEKAPTYKTKKGLTFEVRKFMNGPSPNNFEMAGYFRFKKQVLLVIYSAKDLKSFNDNVTAFDDFLERVSPYDTDMSALSGRCLYPKD